VQQITILLQVKFELEHWKAPNHQPSIRRIHTDQMLHQRKMIERNICSEPIRPSTTLWEDFISSLIMLMPGTTLIPIEDLGMRGRKHL
jgi:hypothetical protein